ncbi:MAG: lycopene cyclase domain-containing protein [Candidatus Gottesmanbacteria bacterium]|nr:lycopene cyclase domain-containing protein [Candidatus Gottesmanbacteria bacterium]
MPEYFLILLSVFIITLLLHHGFHLAIFRSFFRSPLHIFLFFGIILFVGIVWDQYAIWRGHWSFGRQYLLGPRLGYMPIEECGFGLVMPYFGLVVYKLLEKWVKK